MKKMIVEVMEGDCRKVLPTLREGSVDAVVCDPPYEIGFMGKEWDKAGVAFDPKTWQKVLRVLKPGGYLLAFGGTRTYHRLTCAIEDAGFEIRDCVLWLYGQGFPKGQGCLKPAYEPIVLARKPGEKVLPLGIDECRVGISGRTKKGTFPKGKSTGIYGDGINGACEIVELNDGRYPANVTHDGGDEVLEAFAVFGQSKSNKSQRGEVKIWSDQSRGSVGWTGESTERGHNDSGTAARFFFTAKASKAERGDDNKHPTVKPLKLIRWLVKLVCPSEGTVLDPFLGSGTTAVACICERRNCIGIELNPEYLAMAQARVSKRLRNRGFIF